MPLALLMVFSAGAKKYKHSLGVATGMSVGVGYKVMLTDNFTIINDLSYGYSFIAVAGGGGVLDFFGDDANFAYEAHATTGQNIDLSWYVGGGMLLGACGDFGLGKWGVHAIGGIEINMVNAPISITADFRPGYAMAFTNTPAMHAFDASVNFGIRYTF